MLTRQTQKKTTDSHTRPEEHKWHGETICPFIKYRNMAFWEINSGYLRWILHHGYEKPNKAYLREPALQELLYRADNEGHFYQGQEPILTP